MNRAKRSKTTIYEFLFSVDDIARAMKVPPAAVLEEMTDGRVASRWSEHWGAQIARVTKSTNTNNPGSDLSVETSGTRSEISCKTLTKAGVKFQASKYTLSNVRHTDAELLESLGEADLVQVTDITAFPVVRLVTIHSRMLVEELRAGRLTIHGWKARQFYEFLDRTYDQEVVTVNLEDDLRATA